MKHGALLQGKAAGQPGGARGTRLGVVRVLARVAAFLALAWGAGFLWFVATLPGPAPLALKTDGVVALTGDDGRILRGLVVLRAHAALRLLVSGVGPSTTSAEIARTTGASSKLMRCCVDLGREAIDTRSNAEETARWVRAHGIGSVRLVTSDYHIRRARLELAAELGPGVPIVADAVPAHAPVELLAREYSKWLWRAAVRRAERG